MKPKNLLELPVEKLDQEQLGEFVLENITAQELGSFEPNSTVEALRQGPGRKAIGIDIGGDKMLAQLFTVNNGGSLTADNDLFIKHMDSDGGGYIEKMEEVAGFASGRSIPVGLSIGFALDGTKPSESETGKLSILREELRNRYSNDFSNLLGERSTTLNDGPAGLMSGAVQANIKFGEIKNLIYIINGGGIGAATLKNSKMIATEAGHVSISSKLNKYGVSYICDRHYTGKHLCFEYAASNKVGIEAIWQKKTGEALSAIEIEKRFTENGENGNLSLELYDYSAYLVAHLIKGLATAFEIDLNDPATAVVGHGGAFKFPDYGARIAQTLEANGEKIQLLLTKDYSDNACAEGAAIAALTL